MIEQFGTNIGARPPRQDWSVEAPAAQGDYAAIKDPRMWGVASDSTLFYPVGQTAENLPAGFYRFESIHPYGLCAIRVPNETDTIATLPDSESEHLLAEVEQFLALKMKFKERGLLYKRGIMLFGPPGSGKTATIQVLARTVAERMGSIAILADHPKLAADGLRMVRQLEPARQLVVILEDLDALVMRFGEEGYLSLLDGENQVENVIYVATTNYPERLDRRFVDRPSRFDTIRLIGMPSAAARRAYLLLKEPSLDGATLTEFVRASDGYSIAHLRELLILTRCFGRSLSEATERLDGMRDNRPTSENDFSTRKAGFA